MDTNPYFCAKCKKKVDLLDFRYIKDHAYSKDFCYLLCTDCTEELKKIINNWIEKAN